MRLPRKLPARPQPVPLAPDAPITVFFPAWNEEATIAGLIARLPDQIACHPIRTLVIDDGSTDRTAARAAAAAEVIHDYNYAQVLTLDLLAKGFAHREVPISYRFRTTGDSFVSLPRYLRQCIPAIQAELKSSPAILDLKPTVLGPRTTLATTRRAPPAVLARP